MFERRRHQGSQTAYRIALWSLVALVGALYYLDDAPWVLDDASETADPEPIEREADSDVLVVVDYDEIADSGDTFEERDFSVAWINLFEQEIGPVSVATPGTLEADQIEKARLIVLTSSVSGHVPEKLRSRFREHALDGDVLVVERPEGEMREDFAADGRAGERDAEAITYARGVEDRFEKHLLEMPLSTQIIGSTGPHERAKTHLSIDGAPAIYATPIGDGTVIVVDFDLGEQLVGMQQGRPGSDFRVGDDGDNPHTSDLIAEKNLRTSTVPYADLLERFIVHGVIGYYTPLPTFWPFPGGAQGALVAVHEDRSLGDGGGWMLDYETERGAVSTLFSSVDANLSASAASVIHRQGGEIGLAWRKEATPLEIRERVGVGAFEPLVRPLDLETQVETLEEATSRSVRSARVAGGYWDEHWARPFSVMAAEGIRTDTSFTPAPGAGFG
ncbi:MAG: hypothetical protein ACOCV2_15665, partial [Persicimonas sp.]